MDVFTDLQDNDHKTLPQVLRYAKPTYVYLVTQASCRMDSPNFEERQDTSFYMHHERQVDNFCQQRIS